MTKPMMYLRELVEKSSDTDLLKEMTGFAAERLMELEVGVRAGPAMSNLRIPKLRTGSCFPFGPVIDPTDRSMPAAPGAHSWSPAAPSKMP